MADTTDRDSESSAPWASMGELAHDWMAAATAMQRAGAHAVTDTLRVATGWWGRMFGIEVDDGVADDKRFEDEAWRQLPFDLMRRSYQVAADWMEESASALGEIDPQLGARASLFARQAADALSPANSPFTNPEVLRETLRSGGANLLRGGANFLRDVGKGRLSHVPEGAFEVGRDLAVTPGKVVFRNELMELLQYAPTTDRVRAVPLLIVPPWINKYYVMDLRPANSMVKYLVDQGFTVFMISWKNVDSSQRKLDWDDYTRLGPLAALEPVQQITGSDKVALVGYCLGGLMAETTLAYLAAVDDQTAACATFFTMPQDFSDTGEVQVFLNDWDVRLMEWMMALGGGVMDGRNMAATFNMLRANDLIWSYWVNNYLEGKQPPPVDILHWNSDGTRQPAAVHSFLVREIFLEDRLTEPGGIEVLGEPVDLGAIRTPAYVVAAEGDHIIPWRSAFRIRELVGGPVRFVLGESGHIAGIINPPADDKRGYWTNGARTTDPEAWFDGADHHHGSWWSDWARWLKRRTGKQVPPPSLGSDRHPPIADAPGRYVLES